jgi:hypothetical protein
MLTSRKSLVDITERLRQANGRLPESLAGQGTASANKFAAELKDSGGNITGAAAGVGTLAGSAMAGAVAGLAMAAVQMLGRAFGDVAASIHAGFGRLEDIEDAKTKLEAIGTSGSKIESVMRSAGNAAKDTKFEMSEMASVASRAFMVGVKPGQGLDLYLKTVADVATVAQVPLQNISGLFDIVLSSGRVSQREIRQFALMNIPLLEWLSETTGKSMGELRKMATGAGIDLATVEQAIEQHIGGAAQHMGGLRTETAKLHKSFTELGAALLQPLFGGSSSADVMANAVKAIREEVEKFANFLQEHQAGVVTFWEVLGKTAIATAMVVTNTFGTMTLALAFVVKGIGLMLGSLSKGVADAMRGVADVFELFGAKGVADNIRKPADALSKFGDSAMDWGNNLFQASGKIFMFNKSLAESWSAISKWKKEAQDAIKAHKDQGEAAEDDAKKMITLDEALEKLGVTQDQAEKAIAGTDAQFRKFYDTLKEKGAPQQLLDTLTRMRDEFEKDGQGADQLAKALDKMSDSTSSADDKANALIGSLQKLGLIPGEAADSMEAYNKSILDAVKYNSGLADVLDTMGNALIQADGTINTTTKNGQTLQSTIEGIRQKMYAAAAAGNDPNMVWAKAHDALMLLLSDFGITGPAAEELINKYILPQHDFTIQMQLKGKDEVQKELDAVLLQLESARTSGKNEFKVQVTGDPNDLKKVVESYGLQWKEFNPLTNQATIVIPPGTDLDALKRRLEGDINKDPTKLKTEIQVMPVTPQQVLDQANGGNPLKIPAVLDFSPLNPAPGQPGGPPAPGQPGAPGAPAQTPFPGLRVGGGPEGFDWGPGGYGPTPGTPPPNPVPGTQLPLNGPLEPTPIPGHEPQPPIHTTLSGYTTTLVSSVHASGEAVDQAFADGITSNAGAVDAAMSNLVTQVTDYLPLSPAKKGPLSGTGSSFSRGSSLSGSFASGISSNTGKVSTASHGMAQAASSPMSMALGSFVKDMQQWSQLGRHVLDFAQNVSNITFSILTLANQLSGNKLFPNTYVNDPKRQLEIQGQQFRNQQIQGLGAGAMAGPAGYVTPGVNTAGAVGPQSSVTDRQMAIIARAHQLGLTPTETVAVLAVGEHESQWQNTGFMGFGPEAKAAGFNFDQNPQGAIDQFFAQYTGRKPAGLDVNDPNAVANYIWHTVHGASDPQYGPKLLQSMQNQRKAYDQLIGQAGQAAFTPTGLATGALPRPSILRDTGNVPTGALGVQAAAIIAQMFPGITDIGGSRPPGPGTAPGTHDIGRSIDIMIPASMRGQGGIGDQIEAFLQANAKQLGIETTIWRDIGKNTMLGGRSGPPGTTFTWGGHQDHIDVKFTGNVSGVSLSGFNAPLTPPPGGPVAPQPGQPGYGGTGPGGQLTPPPGVAPGTPWVDAQGQVHWAPLSPSPALGPGVGGVQPGQSPFPIPLPIQLQPNDQQNLQHAGDLGLGLPQYLNDLAANDQQLQQAIAAARGQAPLDQKGAVPILQHIDSLIADQNNLRTPQGQQAANALGGIKSSIMSQTGLQQGPNMLQQAQLIVSGMTGLAGDFIGDFDQALKTVQATADIGEVMVRGIANTQDVMRLIDDMQEYITMAQKIAQTTSDALGLMSSIVGAAGSGDTSGGTSAAAMALGAASAIAGIVAQVLGAVNAAIDIGQEVYTIATKYLGRALEQWFNLPGAGDVKYLLDTTTGQMQVYSSENPRVKSTFNTLGRELGGPQAYGSRNQVTNQFMIVQGYGQDPRDTMDDAMFTVRASGQGVFGYATLGGKP